MKQKVYKELKRLYPNATSFEVHKTKYRTFYFVNNNGNREDITDTFNGICLSVTCDILLDKFNKNC